MQAKMFALALAALLIVGSMIFFQHEDCRLGTAGTTFAGAFTIAGCSRR